MLEIALVSVPFDERHRVEHTPERPHPGEELVAPLRVVPRRAEDDEIERVPVHLTVVPHGRHAVYAMVGEGGEEDPVVGLQVRNLSTGRECDLH